jgi:hypothetical protein
MMKKLKIILFSLLALVAIATAIGYYLWNKPKETAEDSKPVAALSAKALYQEFTTDEQKANANFMLKVIEVTGKVTDVQTDTAGNTSVVLDTEDEMQGTVSASFIAGKKVNVHVNDEIKIKAICSGYLPGDILGGEVQLKECALVQ